MNQVRCFNCGNICVKNGKTKAGTQRWLCKECSATFTNLIDNSTKQFLQFQYWLFSKTIQKEMLGAGKSFRLVVKFINHYSSTKTSLQDNGRLSKQFI